ncbi:MAG: methyltransferase domain-containing protein [Candidatus Nanopelagicales bacterium]
MNRDDAVVDAFGDEWSRYDQSRMGAAERRELFEQYFAIFPWDVLPEDAAGIDIGCGSGRWAIEVAPRVGRLLCIDASSAAADVARGNLAELANCEVLVASVDALPVEAGSLDFAYSLGVLHHVPDTQAAIASCADVLKPGAPLLLYLYYSFENRPWWFRGLWKVSDVFRRGVSRSPYPVRNAVSTAIAIVVYWPLARLSALLERLGMQVSVLPLSYYRHRSFYVMRTDARDRFGTQLEQRFSRAQITAMMTAAGLEDIRFSDEVFWAAVGTRKSPETGSAQV